jgi:hypothetical protein
VSVACIRAVPENFVRAIARSSGDSSAVAAMFKKRSNFRALERALRGLVNLGMPKSTSNRSISGVAIRSQPPAVRRARQLRPSRRDPRRGHDVEHRHVHSTTTHRYPLREYCTGTEGRWKASCWRRGPGRAGGVQHDRPAERATKATKRGTEPRNRRARYAPGAVSRLPTAPAAPREPFQGSQRRPPPRGSRFERWERPYRDNAKSPRLILLAGAPRCASRRPSIGRFVRSTSGDLEYLRIFFLAAHTMETTVEAVLARLLQAGSAITAAAVKALVVVDEPVAPDLAPLSSTSSRMMRSSRRPPREHCIDCRISLRCTGSDAS